MATDYKFTHTKRKSKNGKKEKNGKNKGAGKVVSMFDAKGGKFPFTQIHGFELKEMDWTVPDKHTRKKRRSGFDSVRKQFLQHIGETMEPALRNLGLTKNQIAQVKKGNTPLGYNVHHKLPIHGGGLNEFSNLIFMPIGPHNDLHHKVLDPQVAQMQSGDSKKVMVPWSDNMVYIDPDRNRTTPQNTTLMTIGMAARYR